MGKMKYLAEVHRLDALATESRTNRRTGGGLAGTDYEFDDLVFGYRFSCHWRKEVVP